MNIKLENIMDETASADVRGEVFLSSLSAVRAMENQKSYQNMISDLLPLAEKNMNTYAVKGDFSLEELREYVKKYEVIKKEYEKYQIWLVGTEEDCSIAEKMMDLEKVHLLGRVERIHPILAECDYIFVCSSFDGFHGEYVDCRILGSARIVRFDFFREAVGASLESSYINTGIKKEIGKAEGIVTGMSYSQRGINYEKIQNGLICLARPSQDIYMDYYEMLWAYDEIAVKRKHPFRYCIIEMNYYRLWYDASKSGTSNVMLNAFLRLGVSHHLSFPGRWLQGFEEDKKICRELMGEDIANRLFEAIGYSIQEGQRERGKQVYFPDEKQYEEDLIGIKRLFNKNYPETFQENVGILYRYVKFLKQHGIRCLIYLPPFPKIFTEHIPVEKREMTDQVVEELWNMHEVECLNLTECAMFGGEHFADSNHLNDCGADLATDLLNQYMEENWNE